VSVRNGSAGACRAVGTPRVAGNPALPGGLVVVPDSAHMDLTALARSLLEPIPAHRTAGIEVLRAADAAAEVVLVTAPAMTNVIGSLHSSGLIALADAAGLAAIIAACEKTDDFRGVLPLGAAVPQPIFTPVRRRSSRHHDLGDRSQNDH
jgi:hypothetical protein